MPEELYDFLSKKANSIIEETTLAIKGLKSTRYETFPVEDIWEMVSCFYADGLIFLRTEDASPLLTTIQSYAQKKVEWGFRIYEPMLALLTAKEIVLNRIHKELVKENIELFYKSVCKINYLFKIIVVNSSEVLSCQMINSSSVPKIQKYPAWVGKEKNIGKDLEE